MILAAGCDWLEDPPDGGTGGGTATVSGSVTVFQPGAAKPKARLDAALKHAVLEQLNGGAAPAPRSMAPAAVTRLQQRLPRLLVPPSPAPLGQHEPARIRAGEVIVRFHEALSAAAAARRLQIAGLELTHGGFASPYLHLARYERRGGRPLSEGETRELVAQLAARPGVKFTEANGIRHALSVPNDSFYPAMWHLPPINMPAAWDIEKGTTTTVTVAVVDTGIYLHPDLVGRAVTGYDMITDPAVANDGDGRDSDATDPGKDQPQGASSWHGTHCAGTIGATADNNTGIAGINWAPRIVPVRVLGKGGGTDFDIAAGMAWASGATVPGVPQNANPAAVVSMSLGGSGGPLQTYQDVINEAAGRNVVFVVAAGNDNVDASGFTPCNQTGVLCIGATRFNGKRASYSNFGTRIDLMAPGGELAEDANADGHPDGVLSTVKDDATGQPAYEFSNGTSMAAPHISGVVSLMKARNANLTFAQAKSALISTATQASQCNEGCGAGLVNALAALQQVTGQAPAGPARLSLSSTDLSFTPAQSQLALQVNNTGGQPLTVTLAVSGAEAARVGLSSMQATVPAGGTASITVSANLNGLAAGSTAAALLEVSSNGGNATVSVKLRVPAPSQRAAAIALVFQDGAGMWQVGQAGEALAPGFTFSIGVAPGSYFLFGVQDTNGNGMFEDNEPVGLYPTVDSPKELELVANQTLTGLTFTLAPQADISDTQPSVIGAACTSDGPCAPGVCGTGFPGGYCTADCAVAACPLGARCVAGESASFCLASCAGPRAGRSDCRAGYVCENDGTGSGVCLPACTAATDCSPATCNTVSGYCE